MAGVRTTHSQYDEYKPIWDTCSDVVDGQRAIHKGGEKYLPKLKDETEADYKCRVKRSDFYNATWRTISGLVGLAFRKEPVRKIPTAIEPMMKDINLAGVALDSLVKDMVEDVLEYGRIGLLVDHPPMPDNVTAISVATAERMGQRPTIQTYEAESIINWRYARIGNVWQLVLVVLKETATILKSEFEAETEDRYRVLDLDEAGQYRQRVYRIDDKGRDELVEGPIYPLMNGTPLPYVPFTIVGPNGKGAECDEPPLIDLIDANLAHYQVNADYRHGLHYTGLPTLFLAGVVQEQGAAPFYIGSSEAITTPHPDAKGSFIEFTGQGLGAIAEALASLERRMAVLGARMIADESKQAETLGATQIKRAGENSALAAIVTAVSEAVEWALEIFAQWAGASGEVAYQINRKFTPVQMGPQELTALVSAWQSGAVSDSDLFANLQEGEIIATEKTLEEHQAEVDSAEMPRPVEAAPVAA